MLLSLLSIVCGILVFPGAYPDYYTAEIKNPELCFSVGIYAVDKHICLLEEMFREFLADPHYIWVLAVVTTVAVPLWTFFAHRACNAPSIFFCASLAAVYVTIGQFYTLALTSLLLYVPVTCLTPVSLRPMTPLQVSETMIVLTVMGSTVVGLVALNPATLAWQLTNAAFGFCGLAYLLLNFNAGSESEFATVIFWRYRVRGLVIFTQIAALALAARTYKEQGAWNIGEQANLLLADALGMLFANYILIAHIRGFSKLTSLELFQLVVAPSTLLCDVCANNYWQRKSKAA